MEPIRLRGQWIYRTKYMYVYIWGSDILKWGGRQKSLTPKPEILTIAGIFINLKCTHWLKERKKGKPTSPTHTTTYSTHVHKSRTPDAQPRKLRTCTVVHSLSLICHLVIDY